MLIAEFTSRIPNMGECVAHIKSCELLETLHSVINNSGNQQRNIEFKSFINVQRPTTETIYRIYVDTSAGLIMIWSEHTR